MLQELVRAYADAYTVPFNLSRIERYREDAEPGESVSETPTKAHPGGIWRGLFSFL